MKTNSIILYIINTVVCLYSLYMFIITDGNDTFSEVLFQLLFVIDIIVIYRNRKTKQGK